MTTKLIDSHCHIHSLGYGLDVLNELKVAEVKGVEKVIFVGEGLADCRLAISLARTTDNYATVGIHPHTAGQNQAELNEILPLALNPDNRVVAIGECGLDYFYLHSSKDDQKQAFEKQIEFAVARDLPLIFHLRGSKTQPGDAFEDFFAICRRYSEIRGVVHSYSFDTETARKLLKLGLYLSFNGIITFGGSVIRESVRAVPLEKVLVETDAPYLTPVPFRGKINSPQYVVEVAKAVAEIKGLNFDEVARQSTINTKRLLGI